jgi:hypothetical protein
MVNFSKSYPFKAAIAGYVCLFWLDSSFEHRVNAEWDSLSTESTQIETPHQQSQWGVRLGINWVNGEGTNNYKDLIIPRWLSWHGVSLHVDSVDVESHLMLTQMTGNETLYQLNHCRTLKNLNKSANSRTKSKTLKSFLSWLIYVWSVQKTRTNKSHASAPRWQGAYNEKN